MTAGRRCGVPPGRRCPRPPPRQPTSPRSRASLRPRVVSRCGEVFGEPGVAKRVNTHLYLGGPGFAAPRRRSRTHGSRHSAREGPRSPPATGGHRGRGQCYPAADLHPAGVDEDALEARLHLADDLPLPERLLPERAADRTRVVAGLETGHPERRLVVARAPDSHDRVGCPGRVRRPRHVGWPRSRRASSRPAGSAAVTRPRRGRCGRSRRSTFAGQWLPPESWNDRRTAARAVSPAQDDELLGPSLRFMGVATPMKRCDTRVRGYRNSPSGVLRWRGRT